MSEHPSFGPRTRRSHADARAHRRAISLFTFLQALLFVLMTCPAPSGAACFGPIPDQSMASSSAGEGDGIGGTGFDPEPDGIGGTGLVDMDPEQLGHIRASGFSAASRDFDVFVYGTLTGLDSLCVDGLRIELPEEVVIERHGGEQRLDSAQLRVGEVVSIEARSTGGRIRARHVSLQPALAGPVEEIQSATRRLNVMGRVVELLPDALVEDESRSEATNLDSIAPGDFVIVHGLLASDGRLLASYLLRTAIPGDGLVRGIATRRGGLWWVAGLPIEPAAGTSAAPAIDRWVVARGHWNLESGRLLDARLQLRALRNPRPRYLFVEGLVQPGSGMRVLSAAGLEIVISRHAAELIDALPPDTRLWIGGELDADGSVRVRHFRVAPEHVLSPLADSNFGGKSEIVDLLPGAKPLAPATRRRDETSIPVQLGPWAGSAVESARPGLIRR